ncbi:unnamed protein product, partial [Staurois parvus]
MLPVCSDIREDISVQGRSWYTCARLKGRGRYICAILKGRSQGGASTPVQDRRGGADTSAVLKGRSRYTCAKLKGRR